MNLFGFRDVLFFLITAPVIWVFARIMMKEPILPWKEKKAKSQNININVNQKQKGKQEEIPHKTFSELLSNVKNIREHMMEIGNDYEFVLFAEVEPCNYFLLSQSEQEAIDVSFETWLAQLEYPVIWYLQNRYIDLSEPIADMEENMKNQEDLHPAAIDYGYNLINDLRMWQNHTPRYETKRYLLFPYRVNTKEIEAESEEEFYDQVLEKAFQVLYRRFSTAKSALGKANMDVHLLTNEGIVEVLYHAFNRKKALKNKFRDLKIGENLAAYPTADRSDEFIEQVKRRYEDAISEQNISDFKPNETEREPKEQKAG